MTDRDDFARYLRDRTDCPPDKVADMVRMAFDGLRGDDSLFVYTVNQEHHLAWRHEKRQRDGD